MCARFLAFALLLSGLGACGGPPAERPRVVLHPSQPKPPRPDPAASLPPAPAAPLAGATTAAPAYFTPDIDQQIDAADSPGECLLYTAYEQATGRSLPDPGEPRMATWSPWLTDYCPLRDYVGNPDTTRYARPVPLPNRAGRRLFLARATSHWRPALLLLEFEAARYRFVWLGEQEADDFGGQLTHRIYRSAGRELLALQSVEGYMGTGRCASGSANIWLQVWDLGPAACLLSTPIGWYFTAFGCADEAGTEHPGGELTVTRRWQLRDQGRTLWLGGYQVEGKEHDDDPGPSHYRTARLGQPLRELLGLEYRPAVHLLPAGTYRLAGSRYHRAR